MPGSWDSGLKRLVKAVPEDFVALLAPEAECVKNIPVEAELHRQDIHADLLYEISERGKLLLLHLELQSTSEVAVMAERLLEYNVLAVPQTPSFHRLNNMNETHKPADTKLPLKENTPSTALFRPFSQIY